ncbi:hypothetical protein BDR07DRAFT_1390003 [Suillus spraguei]|nr:hypothetical protein BDR07DRAFT_1390003 [Suillus spraguei]
MTVISSSIAAGTNTSSMSCSSAKLNSLPSSRPHPVRGKLCPLFFSHYKYHRVEQTQHRYHQARLIWDLRNCHQRLLKVKEWMQRLCVQCASEHGGVVSAFCRQHS